MHSGSPNISPHSRSRFRLAVGPRVNPGSECRDARSRRAVVSRCGQLESSGVLDTQMHIRHIWGHECFRAFHSLGSFSPRLLAGHFLPPIRGR